MEKTESYTKILKALAEPIEKLYKAGGLAFVFVFICLLFSVFSFILFSIKYYQGPITGTFI